tara:strand:- start:53218 stop:53898 length:681 start_codon:yes stop_codon:yes gene_type:complete
VWFSIIKSKLLVKPKTQLRVQDNKEVEDDEPCKKRLKEYIDFFQKQQKNYDVIEDPEVKNVIEEYKLKPLKEEADYTPLYYSYYKDSDREFKRNLLENNDFFVSRLLIIYDYDIKEDLWENLPERVACEVLDIIDSQTESSVYSDVGPYSITVVYRNKPNRVQWDITISIDDRNVIYFELYQVVRITAFEEIYNDKRKTNLEASLPFIGKIKDVFNNKADPKNWRN